jgi:hypothetical protein
MEQRVYQGNIDSNALAQYLLDTWNQGDTVAQALEGDEGIIVQVGQRSGGFFSDEPQSALTLALEPVSHGLRVTLGEQQWYRDGSGQIMVGGLIGFFPSRSRTGRFSIAINLPVLAGVLRLIVASAYGAGISGVKRCCIK